MIRFVVDVVFLVKFMLNVWFVFFRLVIYDSFKLVVLLLKIDWVMMLVSFIVGYSGVDGV